MKRPISSKELARHLRDYKEINGMEILSCLTKPTESRKLIGMTEKQSTDLRTIKISSGVTVHSETHRRDEVYSQRLRLRSFVPDDARQVEQLAAHKEMSETTLNIPYPYTLPQVTEWIASLGEEPVGTNEIHFAVETENKLMGTVRLILSAEHDKAKLGYWIGKDFWGKGYATEAAAAALAYGFDRLHLNRIYANCFDNNPASVKILERLGMTLEGRLRQHVKKWDAYRDLLVYGILKEEFHAGNPH